MDIFYVDASCQYKGRARFDDTLHVHTCIGHIGNTSFISEFAAYRVPQKVGHIPQKVESDTLVATGQIVAVAVDVQTETPVRAPERLREAVRRFENPI